MIQPQTLAAMKTDASIITPNLPLTLSLLVAITAWGDSTPQPLPFGQNWSLTATNLAAENDWSGVPGFVGHRGDRLVSAIGVNPQTVTADGTATLIQLETNQKNPNTFRTGGVAEFDSLENPTVAIKGSATAGAPFLLLNLNTTSHRKIIVAYNLRDLDGSKNDALQPVAFQFRVGTNGAFTDIPGAFVADASSGPGLNTLVTPITVTLPAEAENQPHIQLRWITTNADGNDEWIGIDDIAVIWQDTGGKAPGEKSKPENPKPVQKLRSPKDTN
jgi:hypothetical protein